MYTPHHVRPPRRQQAAIRERTQAVEKLAIAEAEAGQLHVDLAAALATAEEKRASVVWYAFYCFYPLVSCPSKERLDGFW